MTASFGVSAPEPVGIDPRVLAELTTWVRDNELAIFSILISRHGKLVYELYTSGFTRDEAHYVMSVTKSFTATLVGMAIDEKLIESDEVKLSDALPPALFPREADRARFANVTLHQALGMSALDSPVPPHQHTADAVARQRAFLASENRAAFALTQSLLPDPGTSFLYTDITPYLAGAAVTYRANMTLFDFASIHLFGPLGFRNAEWMHEDRAGNDNAAYGLRIRPIDLQKFGTLYLRKGDWNGERVLSEAWVEKTFQPWIRSKAASEAPNYGNYFWTNHFGPWTARIANGWKGQRVAIVPAEDLVVTMTGYLEEGEDVAFKTLMERFVVPATKATPLAVDAAADARLFAALTEARPARSPSKASGAADAAKRRAERASSRAETARVDRELRRYRAATLRPPRRDAPATAPRQLSSARSLAQ